MKTPSWDEILEFLELDRWTEVRSTGHDFFEKVLAPPLAVGPVADEPPGRRARLGRDDGVVGGSVTAAAIHEEFGSQDAGKKYPTLRSLRT